MQHVEGRLTIAPRERVKEVVLKLSPLLTAAAGVEAVLLTPMPRYMDGPCCGKASHMEGYVKETHLGEILSLLDRTRRGLKDYFRE